jgi:hypothetical protein
VLRDVFDNEDIVATPGLTARQVEGWDRIVNFSRWMLRVCRSCTMLPLSIS